MIVLRMKKYLLLSLLFLLSACHHSSGTRVYSIYAPNTPIDLNKIPKVGKACYVAYYSTRKNSNRTFFSGDNRIVEAAKNGGITKIYLIEQGNEPTGNWYTTLNCTYVYGE